MIRKITQGACLILRHKKGALVIGNIVPIGGSYRTLIKGTAYIQVLTL